MPPISTKHNNFIEYVQKAKGKPPTRCLISCANVDCAKLINVKLSVYLPETLKPPAEQRVFGCCKECKYSKNVMAIKQEKFKEKYGYVNCFQFDYVKKKISDTNMEKYGVTNPFASEDIKKKIVETNIKKYGVDNINRLKSFRDKTRKTMIKKYGIENLLGAVPRESTFKTNLERYGSEYFFSSDAGRQNKEYYQRLYGEVEGENKWEERKKTCAVTLEKLVAKHGVSEGNLKYLDWKEKIKINLNHFIKKYGELEGEKLYNEYIQKMTKNLLKNGKVSSINDTVERVLLEILPVNKFQREFSIKNGNRFLWYDFKIGNKIIEVNGEFWHANPKKYKSTDILKRPGGSVTAQFIWDKDYKKRIVAEQNGYEVVYIWENEVKDIKLITEKIKNILGEKINDAD